MIEIERPNLSQLPPEVRDYIQALEQELMFLQTQQKSPAKVEKSAESPTDESDQYSEPETTMQLITMTERGIAKRTARHHYSRQKRGGMGIFDLEAPENDPPALLAVADQSADLLIITSEGRVFRLPVSAIPATPPRGKGQLLPKPVDILPHEKIVSVLTADKDIYLVLVSERGWVRRVRSNYLNRSMIQGIRYHKVSEGGMVTGACWSNGKSDLLLLSRLGKAIRFDENQVPTNGCLGMRLDPDDKVIGVASPSGDQGQILVLTDDGKGTIRVMEGFRQNKAPSAGGKILIKSDAVIGVVNILPQHDIFVISRLGKLIRFAAQDIPIKEGVVQGVNCMNLRADEVTAFVNSTVPHE